MADNFENQPDLYTLVDEEGVEQTFEMIDVMEVDDERYYALVPYYDDPTKELEADTELVILKAEYDEKFALYETLHADLKKYCAYACKTNW